MIYHGLDDLIKRALEEDLGYQDITTANLVLPDQHSRGRFTAKGSGVIAGLEVCEAVFKHLNPAIIFQKDIEEGSQVKPGDAIARVEGPTIDLLGGERVALNFLQRLSGVATRTRQLSGLIESYKASLLDTRKTTPGLRVLEKYAVRVGGGRNHRFGLYDGVMIKDNHIKAAGGINQAVNLIRPRIPHTIKIEVEAETLEQVREALEAGADIILLDNMNIDTLKAAVQLVNGRALTEASGGIDEDTIVRVAATGVDFISVGALTHSIKSLDISFNLLPD